MNQYNTLYEEQRNQAESELERLIDNWQEIMDEDACAQAWITYIQRNNLKYQMENEDASTNSR